MTAIFLLLGNLVFGASVFLDDFNSYIEGDLNGQGGWEGDPDHYFQVVSDSYEGLGILCDACGQIRIYKFGSPLADGDVLIYLKSNSSVEGEGTLFELKEGEHIITDVGMVDPNIGYSSPEGWKILLENYSVDTWYRIEIQWRSDNLLRYRVNDDYWSDWTVGGEHYLGNYIDSYQFFSNKNAGNFSYFDYISEPSSIQASSEEGISNASPEVKLRTEISGTYHGELPVNYSATDPDFGIGALKSLPIAIFYSDDGGISWKEWIRNQPNTGIYTFDTTKVPDGTNYKIRMVAFDGYNDFGDAISETFLIDNTGPTFDISISPLPAREKDTLLIKITSSEDLRKLPEMKITQKDTEPKIVTVSGSKREFSASYYVKRGSGKAVISILGEDLAGNVGETITSGGSFLVGLYGPPPPIISSPINNQISTQQIIDVTGSGQPDTKIILTLNGVTKFTVEPSSDGSFKIDNVVLSTANKGYNMLSIIAVDKKGEESGEVVLKIKFNTPPKISSTSIVAGEILSGQKEITWTSFDLNDDKLVFSIEYSNDGGITWDYIISDFFGTSYKIDTTQLADGSNYFLKITVDDGTEKVNQTFKNLTIKNNLASITLDIPVNYFTNINTPTLTGKVTGSEKNISLAEYSFDRGKTWQKAIALDGGFNSLTEKFKIPVSEPLKDGKYLILIRATDALNRSVKIARSFTVDTVPPFIESPLLNKAVGSDMDVDLKLDGLQIIFQGKTEPEAKIELMLEGVFYKTTSDKKGEFEVKNVTLPLRGPNKISLTASDLAGNVTKITGVVISNNVPQISVLSPKEGEFFGSQKEIAWQIKDLDNDPIISQILYRKKDKEWITLIKDSTSPYKWDISKIANGDYQMKIVTSDGISETEAILNIFIDNIMPQVILDTPSPLFTNNAKPSFSGRASDDFSGIQYVEYSFNEVDWYKALITEGYQALKASFQFQHRFPLTDGNYKVGVRTTDRAGNIAYSEPLSLTIDTIPPRIGSYLISSGVLILFPEETGIIKLFEDTPYKILVSIVGEPTEANLSAKGIILDFKFNKATLLWESELNFKDIDDYSLLITAKDAAGNSQTREIAILKIVPLGHVYNQETNQPIGAAKATLYFFDKNTASWLVWDGQAFNQKNPQQTNEVGEYGFLVPPGKYRLEVSHLGFDAVRSKELEVKNNYLININIPLTEVKGIFNKILNYFSQFSL